MRRNKFLLIFLVLLFAYPLMAQDTIPQPTPADSSYAESVRVDTIVIRSYQGKIRSIERGAHLIPPRINFRGTTPLTDPYAPFRVPSFWTKENLLSIGLSEVAFVNWNAGGNNSVTALGRLKFARNYKFRYISWQNDLELRFGWNAQEGRKWRKTDDAVRINSTFSYRRDTISNWYYSVKTNFRTQMADGFKYPDRSKPISRFMAPGYLFFGAGASYITLDNKFNLYVSPITHRTTFVLDPTLANQGAFGVEKAVLDDMGNIISPGKRTLTEFGFLVTNQWETPIVDKVVMDHRINLYMDYLKDFGNVDIEWELNFNMVINEYLKASIGGHMIYDDDIRFDVKKDEDGNIIDPGDPRIQLKQLLSIGISYNF